MNYYENENLSQDPIHGLIPFSAGIEDVEEVSERDIIDSPWVQRLRRIHQLQTAWLVFPTAEHTRFQHSLGVMHLASKALEHLYPSLLNVCIAAGEKEIPSRLYLESLVRMAALLHDVGHGPFGHFFDARYLSKFGLNHERLGAEIIRRHIAPMLKHIRRNPLGQLPDKETLDPEQVCFLIVRPTGHDREFPLYLRLLRSLFCGLYTVDNMDFVLRDAYMTGFNPQIFNLERLLHYSFFTEHGLTIHQKGFSALTIFLAARAELFRSVYFHRTVRAIDLSLNDLFVKSSNLLFPGSTGEGSNNPFENLGEYLHFTEWSLLTDVARWDRSPNPAKRELADQWNDFLNRRIPFYYAGETTAIYLAGQSEQTSIYASPESFKRAVADCLPKQLRDIPFEVDIARHIHRPDSQKATAGMNFLYDPTVDKIRPLEEEELYRHIPLSYRLCRIYTQNEEHVKPLAQALAALTHPVPQDDETNM